MDLLIATYKYLIVYNFLKNKWFIIHENDGVYFGIAKYNDLIIVGKRNNASLLFEKTQQGEGLLNSTATFLVLNHKLQVIDEIRPDFLIRDLHGIKIINNEMWATCTFDNIVAIYNFEKKIWKYWEPNIKENKLYKIDNSLIHKIKNNRITGVNHFNTINFNKDCLNILAHNWGESELYFYNLESIKFIKKISLGHKSHNLWYKNDEVFSLSSGTGEIVSSKGFNLKIGGFLRGFGYSINNIYVGICEISKRQDRASSSFYIISFDKNFNKLKDYYFNELGDVTDICYFENLNYL